MRQAWSEGPKSDDYPAQCRVHDCLLTRNGRFEKQTAGVNICMAESIKIRHCSIYDCPRAGINICEYVRQIALGNNSEAVQVIKERNPFPTVIGRICPRPCEDECRRQYVDEPVAINFLKRYAADFEKMEAFYPLHVFVCDNCFLVQLLEYVSLMVTSELTFLLLLLAFLLVLGAILDIFSALVLVVPLILPIAAGFGVDCQ